MYPYTNQNQLSQLLLQQVAQPQSGPTKVVEVTGRAGAEVRIINDYKQRNEVPREMQILYDYLHDRQVRKAAKIKAKQEQFK